MYRLALCVLALCAAGVSADPRENWSKLDSKVLEERQVQLLVLFDNIREPLDIFDDVVGKFSFEDNYEKFNNVTAAKTYISMLKNDWHLPRGAPFSVGEPAHAFEAMTLFNMLYSAKDYDTFFASAVNLRDVINERLYVYVLSITIIYRKDTQGVAIPPIYNVFPSDFNNGEVMAIAQRFNARGYNYVESPSTYKADDNIVIRWNTTAWPYYDSQSSLAYFTHDHDLNAAQYFLSLVTPYWMGGAESPVIFSKSRGEAWWFAHRQLVARYYMESLSNGLGEIPEITDVVEEGYTSGLLYYKGIPYPSRPNNFRLDQSELASVLEKITTFEKRIWEAIDKGFYVNRKGELVSLLKEDGLDILGRLIESNADSPNRYYYKDFIRLWKQVLGNTVKPGYQYESRFTPLVVPSALENYQTSLRDPAFYMIWKRILNLVVYWQKQMPLYKPEELIIPKVSIEKVEVEKLQTFFENTYLNITRHVLRTKADSNGVSKHEKVLVQYPRLNHKPFNVKVTVKSEVAKKVLVKFFLAPKYDSNGYEIPLHLNTENFFLLDQFPYDLTVGESVITRKSTDYVFTAKKVPTVQDIYSQLIKKEWVPARRSMNVYPHRLLLPKGKVGGMKFQFVVYIKAFDGIKPAFTAGYDVPGFPTDRPLHSFQVKDVKNLYFEDVLIYHKEAPEVVVPGTY